MILTLQRFSLLVRCALLWPATAILLLTVFAPASLSAVMAHREGLAETCVFTVMLVLVITGWLDVLINDMMSARWHLRWARQRRHMGYSVLAGVYLIKAFAGYSPDIEGGAIVTANYVGSAMLCAWYTFAAALRPDHAL